ncbi:hypothetical protein Tco_0948850 [Tanacetum coccineum]
MKTSIVSSIMSWKMAIMHLWNVPGALHKPNGMRRKTSFDFFQNEVTSLKRSERGGRSRKDWFQSWDGIATLGNVQKYKYFLSKLLTSYINNIDSVVHREHQSKLAPSSRKVSRESKEPEDRQYNPRLRSRRFTSKNKLLNSSQNEVPPSKGGRGGMKKKRRGEEIVDRENKYDKELVPKLGWDLPSCMDKSKITRKESKVSKHGHENQKSAKPKPQKPKP